MNTKTIFDATVAFCAFGGFCLALYNCILELVRRRPRAKVRVREIVREDGIKIGFAAITANTGETTFTVSEFHLLDRNGLSVRFTPINFDKLPKVVHPGEQCRIEAFGIDTEHDSLFGDVVRIAFVLSTGKQFRSKKLPHGIEPRIPVQPGNDVG